MRQNVPTENVHQQDSGVTLADNDNMVYTTCASAGQSDQEMLHGESKDGKLQGLHDTLRQRREKKFTKKTENVLNSVPSELNN